MKSLFFLAPIFTAVVALCNVAEGSASSSSLDVSALVRVTKQIYPLFPSRLLRQGVSEGEAVLGIRLDPTGRVSDYLVARYTRREFADAAVEAIKQWEFKLREPVGIVMEVVFVYRLNGVLAVERFGGDRTSESRPNREFAFGPCAAAELDHPPKAMRMVSPDYPAALEQNGVAGSVLINFYIDEQGRTRLPVPVSQENALLGSLAAAAVEQWQFEPPTRKGKPVLVHATQRFSFSPKP